MAVEINNQTRLKIPQTQVKRLAEVFLAEHRLSGMNLSIAFISGKVMAKINSRYRKISKTTDVLSFGGEDNFFGEILIDYQIVKKQAKINKHAKEEELYFVLVHGLLHLLGHDDETEEKRRKMIKLGENFLKKFKSEKI